MQFLFSQGPHVPEVYNKILLNCYAPEVPNFISSACIALVEVLAEINAIYDYPAKTPTQLLFRISQRATLLNPFCGILLRMRGWEFSSRLTTDTLVEVPYLDAFLNQRDFIYKVVFGDEPGDYIYNIPDVKKFQELFTKPPPEPEWMLQARKHGWTPSVT